MANVTLSYLRCFWFSESTLAQTIHGYLSRVFVWCPFTMCLSFNIYPVRRLYATLLRFPHLILVYRGLLCGVDVCWSSLDTHWSFMWLSVLLFQSEPCPSWTCHTPSGEVPPRFCVLFGYFFLRRLSSLSDTVPYFEFNAFFRHLKKKRQFLHPFLCACTCVRVLCVVFCLLSMLLLGFIVQFMHTLHSLFRANYINYNYNTLRYNSADFAIAYNETHSIAFILRSIRKYRIAPNFRGA